MSAGCWRNIATFSTSKKAHKDCKNNLRKAIWEHAKLNGVDFRAVGNEPGWVLEISNKTEILFTTDYGQSHYNFASTEVTSAAQGLTTIYEGKNNNNNLLTYEIFWTIAFFNTSHDLSFFLADYNIENQ